MIDKLYSHSLSLLTDLYQLTMSYGYFKNGMAEDEAVFHLFYRKNPFKGNYAVACGLRSVIEYIENFSFSKEDVEYLGSLTGNDGKALFDQDFLNYLSTLRFQGDIDAIEEGRVVFPHEPLLRIKAPLIFGQLLETPLLNMINFQTLIATKTSRICESAKGDPVLEFGLRRAQGIDGALSAAYASMVGGASSTSNVLAGKLYGIPVKGTHAHSWVMSFPNEEEAFEKYAKAMPNNCVFLVDTYDTLKGVDKAIEMGLKLKEDSHQMVGIRLDSGDLAKLSQQAREKLDAAGLTNALIVASNDLSEYTIEELKKKGACIDLWGVGTKLVTAYDQPALGGVYKLSALKKDGAWEYKIKKSEDLIKVSNPGVLQVKRYRDGENYLFDVLENTEEETGSSFMPFHKNDTVSIDSSLESEELLVPIFRSGKCVYKAPSIEEASKKRQRDLSLLKGEIQAIGKSEAPYEVGLEKNLYDLKISLLKFFS